MSAIGTGAASPRRPRMVECGWWCSALALRPHAHERRRGIVFGVPFGTRTAHVIEFGPVRVEEAARQTLREFGEVGQNARRPAAAATVSNCSCHGPHPAQL